METIWKLGLAVPAAGLATLVAMAAPANAADGSAQATLEPVALNGVDGSGQATLEVSGTTLSFTLSAEGLLENAPHVAHIHFAPTAQHVCPTEAADTDGNGQLNTTEGDPSYGGIAVTLTTSGDTSPDSGLAVDRAASGSAIEYSRADVQVTPEVAQAIVDGESVVVVHGVDYNNNGTYDPEGGGPSDLDPALPAEATNPALCGVAAASQMSMPDGGVATGGGSTSGSSDSRLLLLGGAAAAGSLAAAAMSTRRRSTVSTGTEG